MRLTYDRVMEAALREGRITKSAARHEPEVRRGANSRDRYAVTALR